MKKAAVSGMLLALLLTDMLALALNIQPVRAQGETIYIRADGSVDPPTAPISTTDNVTYTLTDNINVAVGVDGIVIERDNIVFDGNGFSIQGSIDGNGIYLSGRENVTVQNTQTKANGFGISLYSSSNNSINGNNITGNNWYGIYLDSFCNHNSINGNKITANYYWGVYLDSSCNYNSVNGNNITNNYDRGIVLAYSYNNSISENNITANNVGAIGFTHSSNNSISENNITNNAITFSVELSSSCNYNSIIGNNIVNNTKGIFLWYSLGNMIYHNDFIGNGEQVYTQGSSDNLWDDGYPSGGNYWSDYIGTDLYSGSYQNVTGSDGIGDTAYSNLDHYPLMKPYPWGSHDIGMAGGKTSRTIVARGSNMTVSLAVFNYGNKSEYFDLTVYANTTLIYSVTSLVVESRDSVSLAFVWNTSDFAHAYSLTTNITAVEGETDLSDNTDTFGIVKITCLGDINGDYVTDAKDFVLVKKAIPSMPSSPSWNSNADMNDDGVVDAKDYQIVKNHIPSVFP